MSAFDKATEERRAKRLENLEAVENEVNHRLMEPWTTKLHDLILYAQMNRNGIRMGDVDKLIARELEQIK